MSRDSPLIPAKGGSSAAHQNRPSGFRQPGPSPTPSWIPGFAGMSEMDSRLKISLTAIYNAIWRRFMPASKAARQTVLSCDLLCRMQAMSLSSSG